MLETLSQYIAEKDWSAVIGMHSDIQIQKVFGTHIDISIHRAESSAITADEIADLKESGHFSGLDPYKNENLLYVLSIVLCSAKVTFFFNQY